MSVILRRLPALVRLSLLALALSLPGLGAGMAQARPEPDDPPPRDAGEATDDADDAENMDPRTRDRKARALYLEGENDYAAGRYELAAAKFARAYELSARPALLFNMANAYERMGEYERAVRHLERYLESPKVEDVVSIRERIKRLQATIDANRARAASGVRPGEGPGGETRHGSQPRGDAAESAASQGEPGAETSANDVATRTGDQAGADRTPTEPGPDPAAAALEDARSPTRTDEPEASALPRWTAYALVTAGGVSVAGAALFGLAARDAGDEAASYCAAATGQAPRCLRQAEGPLDRERRYALLADISLGLAVVTTGAGLYLLLRESGRGARASADPGPGATTIAPLFVPGGVGVGVSGAL